MSSESQSLEPVLVEHEDNAPPFFETYVLRVSVFGIYEAILWILALGIIWTFYIPRILN